MTGINNKQLYVSQAIPGETLFTPSACPFDVIAFSVWTLKLLDRSFFLIFFDMMGGVFDVWLDGLGLLVGFVIQW